ncbi:hypothetical protein ACU61A_08915 [Pseudonocardia sichuanensis]
MERGERAQQLAAALAAGTVGTLVTMAVVGDLYANEPIYVGLAAGLVAFVVGSLVSRPTAADVRAEWDRRSAGERSTGGPAPAAGQPVVPE